MFNTQILAGSSGQGGGEVQQSLKFNDDDSQYLSWTPASAGNRKTWTWSGWVKRGNLGSTQNFIAAATGTSDPTHTTFRFDGASSILFAGWSGVYFASNATFRDVSAWYHIVAVLDTTNATASDRIKVYVNGERLTGSNPVSIGSSVDLAINNTQEHSIGRSNYNAGSSYFDGYMSDIHFIDGQALTPTSFGETVDGYWKAKDYAGTYGTNGFRLTFQDDVVSEGFNAVTYTGNGGTQSLSGLGLSPDFVWCKRRDAAANHVIYDSVRGTGAELSSSLTAAESTGVPGVTAFDADGFTLGNNGNINDLNETYVGWCWDAGSGSPVSNTDGTITSTVKANPAYGFSIVSYTGNGLSNQNAGHGLSQKPEITLWKNRDEVLDWFVYHTDVGPSSRLSLNSNIAAAASNGIMSATDHTSTLLSIGNSWNVNKSGSAIVCYAFHSVANYSSIGSYTGSGVSGNSITGLGFSPAWLMIKSSAGATNDWFIYDNTRQPTNPKDLELYANLSSAEYDSGRNVTFTNDGFDLDTVNYVNNSGVTYIYMAFADTREAAFWKDVSGQGNNWTPNNLDYRNSLPDSPANNWATFNPLSKALYQPTFSNGNLSLSVSAAWSGAAGTIGVTSGKWYWEIVNGSSDTFVGICADNLNFSVQDPQTLSGTILYYGGSGQKRVDGALTSYGAAFSTETIGVALDIDGGNITFYRNNVSQGSIPLSSSTLNGKTILPYFSKYASTIIVNFGQDSTFSGTKPMGEYTDDSQLGTFQYQPPAGFKSLCSANLPATTIIDGSEYFNTVLYTGNGSTQSITGVGFQPDWVWGKERPNVESNWLFDSIRGATKQISSNSANAEGTQATMLTSFDSDGFTMGSDGAGNQLNIAYVSWNWKAGGAAVSNTDGSITSQVSANTTAGFSIVSYVANGTNTATVGHGLSIEPKMVIQKNRSAASDWLVYTDLVDGSDDYLLLNSTAAKGNAAGGATATVFNSWDRTSGNNMIAYCFADVEGFSKAGSYTGNGSTDGTFVYTGFRPAWVMIKETSNVNNWILMDSKRGNINPDLGWLYADLSAAEESGASRYFDFVSNGFKSRNGGTGTNRSGGTFIYLAFAENPFKYANAR